mmetsp:Transcript_7108/g.10172  ORF Transcript_7108/g.10172 Transcript_7108/m.10172 type:complete len:332 (-) Transcript_7108:67-1062(-)
MFSMLGTKLVYGLLDGFKTSLLTHSFGGNVGVHTGTIPVSLNNRLGVESAVDLEVFANTLKDVTRHHKLVTGINSNAGSNLVFLLSRHDFSIGSGDFDSGVKAGLVGGFSDITSETVLGTDRAVVRTLGAVGHTTLGPAKRSSLIEVEKSEFLFKSEPNFFIILSFEGSHGLGTSVGLDRFTGRGPGVAHDKDVIKTIRARTEGIGENSLRIKDDLGVVTGGLVGGRSIEVPLGKTAYAFSLGGRKGAGLGTSVSNSINPNVFSKDLVFRERKAVVTGFDSRVESRLASGGINDTHTNRGTLTSEGRGGRGESSGGADSGEGEKGGVELHR